ncbi:hypothetical protein D3C75_1227970 [compost metagenome]
MLVYPIIQSKPFIASDINLIIKKSSNSYIIARSVADKQRYEEGNEIGRMSGQACINSKTGLFFYNLDQSA